MVSSRANSAPTSFSIASGAKSIALFSLLALESTACARAAPTVAGDRTGLFFGYGGLRAHWSDLSLAAGVISPGRGGMGRLAVLPFGVRTQDEEGSVVPGTPGSAPANVRIVRLPCTGRIDFNLISQCARRPDQLGFKDLWTMEELVGRVETTAIPEPLQLLSFAAAHTPTIRLGVAVLVLLIVGGVLAFAFDRPLAMVGRAVQWVLNETIRRRRKVSELPKRLLNVRDFVRATMGRRSVTAVGVPGEA